MLNKIDLADRARVDEIRNFVHTRLPVVRIIETSYADVPFEVLVGINLGTEVRSALDHDHGHSHAHQHDFTSWIYRREGGFDGRALRQAIARLPRSVYRIKGFLHDSDDPDHRQLVQAVGMRAEVDRHDGWGERPPATELVIIADGRTADRYQVEALLDSCRR